MKKFVTKILFEYEAEDEKKAEDLVLDYIKNGIQHPCMIEIAQVSDPEEKIEPGISFKDLLESLNEDDMNQA